MAHFGLWEETDVAFAIRKGVKNTNMHYFSFNKSIALSACRTGCSVGNYLINHLLYADDLVIFSPSSIGRRALITVCEDCAVSHEMVFNHKKSVILICRSKYMKNVYPVFTLNGKIIDESDTVRYLGHILCNSGKDDKDIMRQCQQLYARGNVLFRKCHVFYECENPIVQYLLFTHVYCTTVVESHSR